MSLKTLEIVGAFGAAGLLALLAVVILWRFSQRRQWVPVPATIERSELDRVAVSGTLLPEPVTLRDHYRANILYRYEVRSHSGTAFTMNDERLVAQTEFYQSPSGRVDFAFASVCQSPARTRASVQPLGESVCLTATLPDGPRLLGRLSVLFLAHIDGDVAAALESYFRTVTGAGCGIRMVKDHPFPQFAAAPYRVFAVEKATSLRAANLADAVLSRYERYLLAANPALPELDLQHREVYFVADDTYVDCVLEVILNRSSVRAGLVELNPSPSGPVQWYETIRLQGELLWLR